jgi:hypothetical protein
MLLKQLLQRPRVAPNLLFRNPFMEEGPEQLVKEIIGLANADVDGPRYIVFGINFASMQGSGIVGLSESAMANLKKAHRAVSTLIEPVVGLAFIYDKIEGRLVSALEIDGCDDARYIVRQEAKSLKAGQSWIIENRNLRAIGADDLERIRTRTAGRRNWQVAVGFEGAPDGDLLKLDVPDRSNPPSVRELRAARQTFDWKRAAKDALGTVNTRVLRLMHTREHGPDATFDDRGLETLIDIVDGSPTEWTEADHHYFLEQTAVKLNLTARNTGQVRLDDVTLELVFPRVEDFSLAERLYADPRDKQAQLRAQAAGYPEVHCGEDAFRVHAALGNIEPDRTVQAFRCPLRLLVGPKMCGQKAAIGYLVRARNRGGSCQGRLKLEFAKSPALADSAEDQSGDSCKRAV